MRPPRRSIAALLALLAAGCGAGEDPLGTIEPPPAVALTADGGLAGAGPWIVGPPMAVPRATFSLTVLLDGRVLAAGGEPDLYSGTATDSAELYDPATRAWSSAAPMLQERNSHAAVRLADGRVLITGSFDHSLATTEIYDPAANSWTLAAPMHDRRCCHAAVLLADGRALVAGGYDNSTKKRVRGVEVYDPATDSWTEAAPMALSRSHFPLVPLAGGELLAIGGSGQASAPIADAEIYDPGADTWTPAGVMTTARRNHAAVALPDGRVLALGGVTAAPGFHPAHGSELYDPASGAWTSGPTLLGEYNNTQAFVLGDGRVLVLGGPPAATEILDPLTGQSAPAGEMAVPHDFAQAVALGAGSLLVAGGGVLGGGPSFAQTDLYGFAANGAPCSAGGPCASGYCVDGVCCGSACGGGVENDCQVCSVARGAEQDGECAALPALAAGGCAKRCNSVNDCPAPLVCAAEGRCVAAPSDGDRSGCAAAGRASGEESAAVGMGLLAALLGWRRRSGARRGASGARAA